MINIFWSPSLLTLKEQLEYDQGRRSQETRCCAFDERVSHTSLHCCHDPRFRALEARFLGREAPHAKPDPHADWRCAI